MVFRAPVWQAVRAALFIGNSDIISFCISFVNNIFYFLKPFSFRSSLEVFTNMLRFYFALSGVSNSNTLS